VQETEHLVVSRCIGIEIDVSTLADRVGGMRSALMTWVRIASIIGASATTQAIRATALLYANGHDLKDPLLSPIYGDVHGFPPAVLTSGTRDLYLSNTVRMHRKVAAGRRRGDAAGL